MHLFTPKTILWSLRRDGWLAGYGFIAIIIQKLKCLEMVSIHKLFFITHFISDMKVSLALESEL